MFLWGAMLAFNDLWPWDLVCSIGGVSPTKFAFMIILI